MGGRGPSVGPIPNSTLDPSKRHICGECRSEFERSLYTQRLLPELTRRRLIEVQVQYNPRSGPWWYGEYYVAIVVMASSSRPRLPLTITC